MRAGDLRQHFFMKPLLSLYMPLPFHVLRLSEVSRLVRTEKLLDECVNL